MVGEGLTAFLDDVAARTSAPGGGAVSAVSVGMAAALVAMAARFSDKQLVEAEDLADKADVMRAHVVPLAEADAAAYAELLGALRLPKDDPSRGEAVAAASRGAAEVPLEIARFAAETALLAARLAEDGNPNLRGDALAAALLAAASARACANLVRINLDEDAEEYAKAVRATEVADEASGRAVAAAA